MTNYYTHPNGYQVPRVTTIVGQLRNDAISQWMVNTACNHILAYVEENDEDLSIRDLKTMIAHARKQHYVERDIAASTGTFVHKYITTYLTDLRKCDKIVDDIKINAEKADQAIDKFFNWYDKNHCETIEVEKTVYDKYYAGTLDWFTLINDDLWIVDFKTSSAVYNEHKWQQR